MKRLYLLLPLLALACSLTATATPTPEPPAKTRRMVETQTPAPTETSACTVTALETLNLRAAAGTSSAVIAILDNGETLTILPHPTQGAWIPVRAADGLEGWINSKYCKEANRE